MTGWRLGYMGAPLWLAKACTKIQGQFTSGAASFSQKAGAYALNADLSDTYAMKDAFLERRDLIKTLLDDIPGIQANQPEGAFYIFPNVEDLFGASFNGKSINNSDDFAEYLLQEALVAVVAGDAFGQDNCIRLSYAAAEEQIREAMKRVKKAVDQLG
jgi:aspartate aminotransferase